MSAHFFLTDTSTHPPVTPPQRWMDAFEGGQSGTWDQVTAAKDGDVVWVSVAYPVWTDAVARLLAARPRPHVVVLSPAPDQTEGLQAINLGARGYCHLYAVPELMQDVASVVAQGGLWVGPELVDRIVAAAIHMALGLSPLPAMFWLAPVGGLVLWPLVFLVLDAARYGRWRRG